MHLREKFHSIWLKIKASRKVRQFFAAGAVSHGALDIGMTIGWFPQALETLYKDPDFAPLNPKKLGLMVLLVIVGALTGLIPAVYSCYKFGRIWTLRFFCLISLLGWILIAAASNLDLMLAGRFITGISGGGFSIIVPLYLIEITETKWRGIIGVMFAQQVYGGILLAFMAARNSNWRILTFNCAPIPIFCFFLTLFIPETPIYYLRQEKFIKAEEALKWLRANDNVDAEFRKLQDLVGDTSSTNRITCRGILFTSPYKSYFLTCLVLFILQQLTCIGPFNFYTSWINIIGGGIDAESRLKPTTVGLIFTGICLLALGITSVLSDKKSRKKILVISCCSMVICYSCLGILYYCLDRGTETFYWVQFGVFCVLVFVFAIGFLPLPWILLVETAHSRMPELSVFIVTASQWLIILAISLSFDLIRTSISLAPIYWLCGLISLISGFISYLSVPETNGKNLNEIQHSTLTIDATAVEAENNASRVSNDSPTNTALHIFPA